MISGDVLGAVDVRARFRPLRPSCDLLGYWIIIGSSSFILRSTICTKVQRGLFAGDMQDAKMSNAECST